MKRTLQFMFTFFDKMVNKRDFSKSINLYFKKNRGKINKRIINNLPLLCPLMTELIRFSSSLVNKGKHFLGGVTGRRTCSTGGGGGGGSFGRVNKGASWLNILLKDGLDPNLSLVVSLKRFDMLELSVREWCFPILLLRLFPETFLEDFCLVKRLANSAK